MPLDELVTLAQQALVLSLLVSLPVLVAAAALGLLSAIFQAVTQVQDPALGHLPKLAAVTLALALAGPWMGRQILGFALRAFGAE